MKASFRLKRLKLVDEPFQQRRQQCYIRRKLVTSSWRCRCGWNLLAVTCHSHFRPSRVCPSSGLGTTFKHVLCPRRCNPCHGMRIHLRSLDPPARSLCHAFPPPWIFLSLNISEYKNWTNQAVGYRRREEGNTSENASFWSGAMLGIELLRGHIYIRKILIGSMRL